MENHHPNIEFRREQMLSALDDNSVAAIFVKDREGVYRLVNRACELIWRLPREKILGRTDAELLPAECARTLREHDRDVMESGQPLDFEERIEVSRGSHVFLASKAPLRDDRGAVVGICGVAIDVTDVKRVENSLRESEQRFRKLADSLPVLVWLSGTENEGVWFNRTWLEFTGRSLEEELGNGWLAPMHPDDRDEAFAICEKAFRDRRPFSVNFRMRRADGQYRWMLDSGTPRFGPDGEFAGFVGSCVDITERQETEQRLRDQAAALVAADRRKDEFLAMLAHELRNPLAPILLAAESLSEIKDSRVTDAATTICQQVGQLRRLVDDLLDVARITRGKIRLKSQPVAVNEFLRVAVDTIRPVLAERGHELVFASPPDAVVEGDPERLAQVFANLLHNAAKFTPAGGRIELSATAGNGVVEFRIRDNGRGIPRQDLPFVFDLFHQTHATVDRAEGGLGIGLTLVKRLVEMHGGSIAVASAGPGLGCEVTVRLPGIIGAPGVAPSDGDEGAGGRSSTIALRVLVVDDNKEVTVVLGRILSLRGHTVETAYDGDGALEAAAKFRPDVVILDIGLPGVDGVEVARRLRASDDERRPLLVAMSGYGAEEQNALMFDVWLMKPVSRDQIDRILEEYVDSRKGIDET